MRLLWFSWAEQCRAVQFWQQQPIQDCCCRLYLCPVQIGVWRKEIMLVVGWCCRQKIYDLLVVSMKPMNWKNDHDARARWAQEGCNYRLRRGWEDLSGPGASLTLTRLGYGLLGFLAPIYELCDGWTDIPEYWKGTWTSRCEAGRGERIAQNISRLWRCRKMAFGLWQCRWYESVATDTVKSFP